MPLVDGELYHVFNRGSEKRNIFTQPRDYKRFRQTLYYYQFLGPKPKFSNSNSPINPFNPDPNNKIIEILGYCLMPNHFHLLIRQLKENGISTFLRHLSNSYARYFNVKYKMVGPLFQGRFKVVLVESDEQLIHLSRYIHINPAVSGLTKDLENYLWSSYLEYIQSIKGICNTDNVLNYFTSVGEYQQFCEDQTEYGEKIELIKHQLIDISD